MERAKKIQYLFLFSEKKKIKAFFLRTALALLSLKENVLFRLFAFILAQKSL
jgi:hypothetical protein